jgi:hypothetical protein
MKKDHLLPNLRYMFSFPVCTNYNKTVTNNLHRIHYTRLEEICIHWCGGLRMCLLYYDHTCPARSNSLCTGGRSHAFRLNTLQGAVCALMPLFNTSIGWTAFSSFSSLAAITIITIDDQRGAARKGSRRSFAAEGYKIAAALLAW